MDGVVPVEEALAVGAGVFDAAEPLGEVRTIFECFELGLGVRIVIGDVRPAVGLGDLQIDQQGGHGLAAHAGAAVGVQGQRTGDDVVFPTVSAISCSASCADSRRAIIQPTT